MIDSAVCIAVFQIMEILCFLLLLLIGTCLVFLLLIQAWVNIAGFNISTETLLVNSQ